MDNKGIIINKYGAVDAQEIMKLIGRVNQLQKIIEKMAGVEDYPKELDRVKAFSYIDRVIYELPEDIKKMKELTHCDDYEYQTTPEKTTLIKKQKETK